MNTPTRPRGGPRGSSASGGLVWNLGSAVLPLFGSFVVSLLIAPYLGPAGFGAYTTVMAAATLILIVAKFGVHSATSRLVTEREEEAGLWLRAGLRLRTAFTLGMALVSLVVSPWLARALDGEQLIRPFWLVAPLVISTSYYEFSGEALVGLRRFRELFANRAVFMVLRLAAIAWVRLGGLGATAFLAGHTLAQSLPAGWLTSRLLRKHPGSPDPSQRTQALRRTFELSLPLAFSSASFLVYAHTDRLMLAWFTNQATVGQFGVARNVLDASLFPTTALAWSLRPALVRALSARRTEELRSSLADGLRLSWIYAVGAPALMAVFGPPVLVHLYGSAYAEAGRLLAWMLPIMALRGLGTVIFPALLASDAQATYARLMVWTALVNVGANLLLIPRLGAEGAILATVVALVPFTVGGFWKVRQAARGLPWRDHLRSHATAVVGAVVVVGAVSRWLPSDAGLPLLIALGALSTAVVAGLPLLVSRSR